MSVITLHVVSSIPYSNLNRNENGIPKTAVVGGVERALISSQAIKRGARRRYEEAVLRDAGIDLEPGIGAIVQAARKQGRFLEGSVRSGNLAELIAERADAIIAAEGGAPDPKTVDRARALVGSLVKNGDGNTKGGEAKEKKTSSWLSAEEIEAAAATVAAGSADIGEVLAAGGRTGSLAIASFGRMFAKKPDLNTHAAVAVGFSLTTHATVLSQDYFITGDEANSESSGVGAGYIDVATYTSGVFYRSVTIDPAQLRRNWTGFDRGDADHHLGLLVRALIDAAPSGKQNSTAPFVPPLVVLAEVQSYRFAYDFESPVLPGPDGGYQASTLDRFARERQALLRFDPGAVTGSAVAGVAERESLAAMGAGDPVPVTGVVDFVVGELLR